MIYVVAAPQCHHFKQLFKVLDLMGFEWAKKCKHVDFGLVKGMSTRRGDVKFLEDILDEAKKFNYEIMAKNEDKFKQIDDPEGISDVVGLSAVFIQDLKAKRVKDYEFSWDRMCAEHGDTGYYFLFFIFLCFHSFPILSPPSHSLPPSRTLHPICPRPHGQYREEVL